MIIQSTPLGSPWKRGSLAFLICNSMSIFFVWMAFDIAHKPEDFTGSLWLAVLACSAISFGFGMIFNVARLKYMVFILGFFVVVPILIFSSISFFVFLELSEYEFNTKAVLIFSYVAIVLLWGIIRFLKIVKLEKEVDYLKREIKIEGAHAYFSPDRTQDLSDMGNSNSRNFTLKQIFSITAPISLLGYPLQRYITDVSGYAAAFAFISIISVPLSVYLAGKIFEGYCLWIYLGGKFEREHKVKIFLR